MHIHRIKGLEILGFAMIEFFTFLGEEHKEQRCNHHI